ncbi:hypothetical protein [Dyella sp. 2HG41-7]|uniref:hypothetical protein n=1 Tax=Dyella sp. 2HG41-7 TaxID=2883239 RepID=UPI001F44A6B5|nr:hypothetical protein [Dyella sp. 2HG41-7]
MCVTTPELALSAHYRKAQRLLSAWLDADWTARRQVFAIRTALAALDATDRHRLTRWLAWWCLAVAGRGEWLLGRIERLDPVLGASTELALSMLPIKVDPSIVFRARKSA